MPSGQRPVLRSQTQADYAPDDLGHFGLALRRYCHFTSPIRRYADVLVHRALIDACRLGTDGLGETDIAHSTIPAEHISATERRAALAERNALDRYTTAFLAERVGAQFSARVTGVTRFGLFVKLHETGADGLIPIRSLPDDWYEHDEVRHQLVGRNTGGTYTLGEPVTVELMEADVATGSLAFTLIEGGKPGKAAPGRRGPKQKSKTKGKRGTKLSRKARQSRKRIR